MEFDPISGKFKPTNGAPSKKVFKKMFKDYIIKEVGAGGSIVDLATGEGDRPSYSDICNWESEDGDFKARLNEAQNTRAKYIEEQYKKRLLKYLKSPRPDLKEELIQLEKSLTYIKKFEDQDDLNVTIIFEDSEELKGVWEPSDGS